MSNLMADTPERKLLLSMAAIYVEEAELIEEFIKKFDQDTEDKAVLEEAITEGFLRLDMNYGEDVKDNALEILHTMWAITSREDLEEMLEFIYTQGHRTKFMALAKTAGDPQKFKQVFEFDFSPSEEVAMSEEDFASLREWIQKVLQLLPNQGILAWDMARYIHLIRLGVLVGYLSASEAWGWVDKVGPLVQGQFKDWMQFAQSYLIGLTFWAGQEDLYVKAACERLLGEPALSPWGYFHWS